MKKSVLIFFLITHILFAKGQYRFTHFDTNMGLSQGNVNCIFQDSEGYMWIATQDGLNKFDGYNFTVYRHNEDDTLTLSDSFILSITEDSNGRLWVGTRNGLNSLNKKTGAIKRFYVSTTEKHEIQNPYGLLCKDKYNYIWFEHSGRIYCLNPSNNIIKKLPNVTNMIMLPVADSDKNIWLCNPSGEIFKTDSSMRLLPFGDINVQMKTWQGAAYACINAKGIIWMSLNNEIYLFNTLSGKWFIKSMKLPNNILHISHNKKGNTWVGTTNGLYKIKHYVYEHIVNNESDASSIPPGPVYSSFEDKDQHLWVGTGSVGISLYQPEQSHFKIIPSPVYKDAVWSVLHDSRGILWLGTSSSLFRIILKRPLISSEENVKNNIENFQKINLKSKLIARVISLTEDPSGNIWAGTSGWGIFVIDRAGNVIQHFQNAENALPDNTVFYLRTDATGKIWASTAGGQACYDFKNKVWTLFKKGTGNELCGNYVISSYQDHIGNTWICSSSGLDVYDTKLKRMRYFLSTDDTTSFLKRTLITSCTEDFDNNIWIATLSKGIYQLKNNGETHHYYLSNGMESDIIYAIQTDRKGRIWASTSRGISVYDSNRKSFYNLGKKDGIPSGDYAMAGYDQNIYGELFWCSTEGLVAFNPDAIQTGIIINKPCISALEINYKPVVNNEQLLNLYSDDKIVKIDFVSIHFTHADKIMYQYRMKGFDENWITALPGLRSATFTNLPFGKYTFEVKAAANLFELKGAPVTALKIERFPPFWMRLWFIVPAGLLLILLLIFIVKYISERKLKLQLQAAELSQKIHLERERISRDLHDNIGSQLTYIISSLDNIAYTSAKDFGAAEVKSIESLGEFTRSTMQQLRETIWTINKDIISVSELKNKIQEYTQRILFGNENMVLNFSGAVQNNALLQSSQAINVFRVVQEAVTNCMKHSEATILEIKVDENENTLLVEIKDNGKGFCKEQNIEPEHFGFENMKKRAKDMNGILKLTSIVNEGTVVILTIPVKTPSSNQEES